MLNPDDSITKIVTTHSSLLLLPNLEQIRFLLLFLINHVGLESLRLTLEPRDAALIQSICYLLNGTDQQLISRLSL